jgi:hypothetical protein
MAIVDRKTSANLNFSELPRSDQPLELVSGLETLVLGGSIQRSGECRAEQSRPEATRGASATRAAPSTPLDEQRGLGVVSLLDELTVNAPLTGGLADRLPPGQCNARLHFAPAPSPAKLLDR